MILLSSVWVIGRAGVNCAHEREFDVLRTLAEGKAHYTKRMECVIMGSIGMRRVGCKNGAAF